MWATLRVMPALTAALLLGSHLLMGALGENSVGMNVHDGRSAFLQATEQLGATWVRMDANWFVLEPAPDDYRWSQLDAAVDEARGRGLQVYLTLAYTPAWVPRSGDTDGRAENDVPQSSAEWEDFVRDAVTHFRARGVTHFGLWNEANLQSFFEGSVDEYASRIVVPGAAAVRAVCNDCKVLGPDLAHVGAVDDYLEAILQRTRGAWDIITHHSYNGFSETGWFIWDGDGFLNAIEQQRFPFTRRGLRQVLDAEGWTGEVWITETGYRATPPGDGSEEGLQAIYVRRVLEEQLQRAWWTNSFFYEISDCGPDQPGCTIDGFGVLRAQSGTAGARSFPADFRVKPAYTEIQTFIANNPAVVGAAPPAQCGDGVDNDGDGRIDTEDRGCSGPNDDDESDDPPRARIEAAARAVTLDGDLSDWGGVPFTALSQWQGTEALGVDDLSAELAAAWTPGVLFIALRVQDDLHDNDLAPELAWQGDGVQLAFDVGRNGGTGYDGADDHELSFARRDDGNPSSFRHVGPAGRPDTFELATGRQGLETTYEIRIGWDALGVSSGAVGAVVGFTALVNDADGAGRVGWLEWTPGVGREKRPEDFGELALAAATPLPDAGPPTMDAGTAPEDAAGTVDSGLSPDAGVAPPDAGPSDAGLAGTPDAETDGRGNPPAAEGCRCAGRPPAGVTPWTLALLVLALFRRNRK